MIYWAPFLHFYQPPTQFHFVLKKICNESYRPLFKMFSENPRAKVSINICGVLTEMLNDHGAQDIISDVKKLAGVGKLEFVESAKYHPILPLIPSEEIRRQVKSNHQTNAYFFGDSYKPRGFFPPEMCYSNELAAILSEMGYEWLLLSGVAHMGGWPFEQIHKARFGENRIITFFRDDIISNRISFHNIDSKSFVSELIAMAQGKKDIYVITAMDAETFGHHIQNWEKLFLAEVYKSLAKAEEQAELELKQERDLVEGHRSLLEADTSGKIKVVTISELIDLFPEKEAPAPLLASWSSSRQDIEGGNFYPLWKHSDNPIHKLQWEHMNICFDLVDVTRPLTDNEESARFAHIARLLIDRAIHSCQFWWANKGRMWDINMVNKGLLLQEEVLLNTYKAISVSNCKKEIKRDCYHKVLAAREIAGKIRDYLLEVQ